MSVSKAEPATLVGEPAEDAHAPSTLLTSSAPQPVAMQCLPMAPPQGDPRLTARGVPLEQQNAGKYQSERYCGLLSVVIGVLLFPCICCCPLDEREVWESPEGRRVILKD